MTSDAAKAGIAITTVTARPRTHRQRGLACAVTTGPAAWQGLLYGGWVYAPDYYPTGDALFATGAGPNVWSFSTPSWTS